MHRILFLLFFLPSLASGQAKYLLYLKDKSEAEPKDVLSERSLARRSAQNIPFTSTDFPVTASYLKALQNHGWEIEGKSKWLNAVLVSGKDSLLASTVQLPFISSIEGNADIRGDVSRGKYARTRTPLDSPVQPISYGSSTAQIRMLDVDTMHLNGFLGKGVLVAVMDGGYSGLYSADAFKHLDILHTYNYVHHTAHVDRDDTHGTNVLSLIAGFIPGKVSGTAPEVQVSLYTTEDVVEENESKLEEVYWVFAAEHADSLGADIINTSLGYSLFSDPAQNYTYQQMDGKSTIISRAANYAASVGMVVVIAAGNEGNSAWKYISAPADAEKVIAVGAVTATEQIAAFSSYGPSPDGRIKPELSAQGVAAVYNNTADLIRSGNGTSYAAPLITGLMAGLRQQFPTLSALQLREIAIKSGDRHAAPDQRYGYGIPSYTRAVKIALSEYLVPGTEQETAVLYPNPSTGNINIAINGRPLAPSTTVEVWDNKGTKQGEGELQDRKWEALQEGVYFVKAGKRYLKMLVKK